MRNKIKCLEENALYEFEGKILRLIKSPFNKANNQRGLRPILKQLTQKELNELILKNGK